MQFYNNFVEITYNDIYLPLSWRSDTHGYSEKKPIHSKPAYVFFEIFSKSFECFIATYWYIVIETVK